MDEIGFLSGLSERLWQELAMAGYSLKNEYYQNARLKMIGLGHARCC